MNRRSFFSFLVVLPLVACYRKAEAGIPHPDRPSHAVDPKRLPDINRFYYNGKGWIKT